jgi:hypothetical protein
MCQSVRQNGLPQRGKVTTLTCNVSNAATAMKGQMFVTAPEIARPVDRMVCDRAALADSPGVLCSWCGSSLSVWTKPRASQSEMADVGSGLHDADVAPFILPIFVLLRQRTTMSPMHLGRINWLHRVDVDLGHHPHCRGSDRCGTGTSDHLRFHDGIT